MLCVVISLYSHVFFLTLTIFSCLKFNLKHFNSMKEIWIQQWAFGHNWLFFLCFLTKELCPCLMKTFGNGVCLCLPSKLKVCYEKNLFDWGNQWIDWPFVNKTAFFTQALKSSRITEIEYWAVVNLWSSAACWLLSKLRRQCCICLEMSQSCADPITTVFPTDLCHSGGVVCFVWIQLLLMPFTITRDGW